MWTLELYATRAYELQIEAISELFVCKSKRNLSLINIYCIHSLKELLIATYIFMIFLTSIFSKVLMIFFFMDATFHRLPAHAYSILLKRRGAIICGLINDSKLKCCISVLKEEWK